MRKLKTYQKGNVLLQNNKVSSTIIPFPYPIVKENMFLSAYLRMKKKRKNLKKRKRKNKKKRFRERKKKWDYKIGLFRE